MDGYVKVAFLACSLWNSCTLRLHYTEGEKEGEGKEEAEGEMTLDGDQEVVTCAVLMVSQ